MQSELEFAQKWLTQGKSVVLAVVAKTWGSAPRPVGSLMVISEQGHFEGSVSGGCVEGSVVAEATALFQSPCHKVLTFSVEQKTAWQVGLACGGTIEIHLFTLAANCLGAITQTLETLGQRKAGALHLSTSTDPAHSAAQCADPCAAHFSPTTGDKDTAAISDGQMILPVMPKIKLVIIGAVHIAQHLAPMAVRCGYDVTVVDPREIFLGERSFSEAECIHDWPDEYIAQHPLDACTALITLTHDPKIDEAALRPALDSTCFYIGALGSKKTQQARLDRLADTFSPVELARIHGPIGLAIGAKSPAEIAVSILAELTAARRSAHVI